MDITFSIDVYQENYNITAYDHWSDDTKQDAWFTAYSLIAVFETMSTRPKWVTIISDNGPHNSEMMWFYHIGRIGMISQFVNGFF